MRNPGRTWSKIGGMALAGVLMTALASAAALTPEQQCLVGRTKAWNKYLGCQSKVISTYYAEGGVSSDLSPDFLKCVVKLDKSWNKLGELLVEECQPTRFLDLGTVVQDRLTGLLWEKKTEDASIHDKDNAYGYGTDGFQIPNGSAFTVFLDTLNDNPACFEGLCDWRVPTFGELQTIRLTECENAPCVSAIFAPAVGVHLTSTLDQSINFAVFTIHFGGLDIDENDPDQLYSVRAVRGGLL
jgi:hypothetical protein